MNMDHLACFLAVAKYKSITKAAQKLFISRTILSKRISAFESELGVTLLIRNGPLIELTAAGKLLLEQGPELMNFTNNLQKKLRNIDQGSVGHISMKCVKFKESLLPDIRSQLAAKYPGIELNVTHGFTGEIISELQNDLFDVGVVLSYEINSKYFNGLKCIKLYKDDLVLIVGRSHSLASRKNVYARELVNHHFCYFAPQNDSLDMYTFWQKAAGKIGVSITKGTPMTFLDHLFEVKNGKAYSFIQRGSFLEADLGCVSIDIIDADLSYYFTLAYKEDNDNPSLPKFLEVIKTVTTKANSL